MSILRADSIRDRAGTGAPDFPNGLTGNLTGTATTATTLSGTPNISVGTLGCGNVTSTGDVTGVNATFSGNLTVQGTTTTIDTAVTSVDTLQVDGNVAIGTDTTYTNNSFTTLSVGGNAKFGLLELKKSDGVAGSWIDCYGDGGNGDLRITTAGTSGNISFLTGGAFTEKVRITSGGTAIFKAGLAEKFNNVGTTLATTTNHAITDGNVILFTGNEPSAGRTLGITGVHSILAVGESFSVTAIISPNGTGTIGGITIEGAGQTIQWSGGSAPSAGASGRDVYTFTFLKTGSANTNYEVFGAATNYA
jgi:hypothetical protein